MELHSKRGRLSITVDQEERGSAQASPSFPVGVESHLYFGGENERCQPQHLKVRLQQVPNTHAEESVEVVGAVRSAVFLRGVLISSTLPL